MGITQPHTVTGLGTADTTMPIVGCGESIAGLPQGMVGPGVLASALLTWHSLGRGEWSFCSCCFLWIFRCSCCFASTEGEGRVFTCGWKEFASAVGTNAETGVGVFSPVNRRTMLGIMMSSLLCHIYSNKGKYYEQYYQGFRTCEID